MTHETNEPMSGMFDPLGGLRGTGLIVPAHDHSEPMIHDLAQHLAYHANVSYRECRGLDATGHVAPTVTNEQRTDGNDREFVVVIEGRIFNVTVEEMIP